MSSIQLRYFQPSWFQIDHEGIVIYVDPAYLKKYHSKYPANKLYSTWPDPIDGLPDPDLQKADYIFITHHHKDHCKAVTVNRLMKRDTKVVAPAVCSNEIENIDIVVSAGEEIKLQDFSVQVVPAYNTPSGNSTMKQHKKGEGVGYIFEIGKKRIYHAGDTDLISEMKELGRIDLALIPIGDTFTMNSGEALSAIKELKPNVVIPMHALKASKEEFAKKARDLSDVVVLQNGETYKVRSSLF